jgi:ABC-type Mn2+/Zn2+ transport system ATPase subunit
MQSFNIIRKTKPSNSFRVASVMGSFDLQDINIEERFEGAFDFPNNWQIGAVIGNSGTGKTTIAKELFQDAFVTNFEYTKDNILDDMPMKASVAEITQMFNSVGFSSPPSWLKPYQVLSNGQKMRVDLANALLQDKELIVFDEFTSVVDRTIAQVGSFAVQKSIRKTNKKFIAVSCHFDIVDWLMPDWVFNTNDMTFQVMSKKKDQIYESRFSKQKIQEFGTCLLNTTI